jgi:UDP-N-acetylmuramoylalanine--D-glutamate ligase
MDKLISQSLLRQAIEARKDLAGHPDEHSMEAVAEIKNVLYINDSKATSVLATRASLKSIQAQSVVLIIGGTDYKNDYSPLIDVIREKVKVVIYLGGERDLLLKHISKEELLFAPAATLEEAMIYAEHCVHEGDVVLFSPACPSFDPFDNYKNRGNNYKRLVNHIASRN